MTQIMLKYLNYENFEVDGISLFLLYAKLVRACAIIL